MLTRLLTSALRPSYVRLRDGTTDLVFERRLGVRTSGEVAIHDLGIAAEGRMNYKPIGWLRLRQILPRKSVTNDDVFLDIGSGMGRAILLAANTYPFRRVIGVELSERLIDIARDNIDRCTAQLRCTDIEIVNADAVEYRIPDDVTVVFMYCPVLGESFAAVVRNLLDSYDRNPRDLRIIYANPTEESALLATGRIRMIRQISGLRPGRQWSTSNAIRMYSVTR